NGIDYVKSDVEGFERYIALYHTPQVHGGCAHCRFFLMCKGQCPGTAIDGDWRNRSEHCAVWKALYSRFERELLEAGARPLSNEPVLRTKLERELLTAWEHNTNSSIAGLLRRIEPEKRMR